MTTEKIKELESNETAQKVMDFIVNELGINLCSVDDISISKQDDGQLKDIAITFIPAE